MFKHSLATGLTSDLIRSEIKPHLVRKSLKDEDLILLMNKVMVEDNEWVTKVKGKPRVNHGRWKG